jgi:ribosomal protein S18 acetylase RimI-like enzyme
MHRTLTIEVISPEAFRQLDEFFIYLREHIGENGAPGNAYFQPMSRSASIISAEREPHFRNALEIDVAKSGWRRLWVARSTNGCIVGHIDLRGHNEQYAPHRCLLGIGVQSANRRNGIGSYLLENAINWAYAVASLEWIDLQVLSTNKAAKNLYQQFGFVNVGEIPDMFKIDGQHFSYTYMTLRLGGVQIDSGPPNYK